MRKRILIAFVAWGLQDVAHASCADLDVMNSRVQAAAARIKELNGIVRALNADIQASARDSRSRLTPEMAAKSALIRDNMADICRTEASLKQELRGMVATIEHSPIRCRNTELQVARLRAAAERPATPWCRTRRSPSPDQRAGAVIREQL